LLKNLIGITGGINKTVSVPERELVDLSGRSRAEGTVAGLALAGTEGNLPPMEGHYYLDERISDAKRSWRDLPAPLN
jgi:hypothetical protein